METLSVTDKSTGKKKEKKLQNKLKKKALNLLKDFHVTISDIPTNNLYLGNTGMLCGFTREYLLKLFQPYGKINNLIQPLQKSFSFLSYNSIESATLAKENLNGHDPISKNPTEVRVPILIHYLNELPRQENIDKSYPKDEDADFSNIEGLEIVKDFINEEEEIKLTNYFLQSISGNHGSLKHRSVQHFGYEFLYGTNNINKSKPLDEKIPDICNLIQKHVNDKNLLPFTFDQLTVNTYEPGQGIPSHIDTHSAFEDGIASLTLNSQTVMEFIHPNGEHMPVILPRRSLLIMKGAARYLWSHGIVPRKHDIIYVRDEQDGTQDYHLSLIERGKRVSLTFRKILHTPCRCLYHTKCDSHSEQTEKLYVPQSCNQAHDLESEHVHDVYEEIAEHFSSTRHSPWPRVKDFITSLENGSIVADIGCGNGKYLGVNKHVSILGSDRSWNLCEICVDRGFSVVQSDIVSVPFRNNLFDACICIAVIHHLSTEERRLNAISELVRITKVNGLVLIYVWAIEQTEESPSERTNADNCEETEISKDRKEIQISKGRNTFQQQDLLIPWHLKGDEEKIFHRFYHVFKEGELQELCKKIENVEIKDLYYDKGNWCVILKKIS